MEINRDDMAQGDSPITPPSGDIEETELYNPVPLPAPEPVQPGWEWIGSPSRPEAQEVNDGISDLFTVDDEDDTTDLISVDIENDILDANPETGDLSDLVDVTDEDIMGDPETGQVPLNYKPDPSRRRVVPRYQRTNKRYNPPTSMRGLGA